jgi:hypothetical protein
MHMYKLLGSKPSVTSSFVAVNGKVLKFVTELTGMEVFVKDEALGQIALKALETGAVKPPSVGIKITEATEADLCAAQKSCPKNTLELENLIAYVKASNVPTQEPGPLRIEIVNPEALDRDQVVTVRRDPDGKLTGLTAVKV